MFFFFPHTYCPMACIKWVLPRPTPPYTKRGLYVRAGACATARLAACAISLFGPTTKDSNVFRGFSPGTVVPGRAAICVGNLSLTVESSEAVCVLAADGTQNLTERVPPKVAMIARSKRATNGLLPSMVSLRAMEKNCQKPVNTRQKGSTPRSKRFAHESRANMHSFDGSSSFLRCSFLQLEVSRKCSQLIHMRST